VRYARAMMNLDKVKVTADPTIYQLPDVFRQYGNRLRIKVWGNTDVITIESRDPLLQVLNVLKEFEIPTYADLLKNETDIQSKHRL